jgi:pimeloyl-ACP methyl ester carboxylesterase
MRIAAMVAAAVLLVGCTAETEAPPEAADTAGPAPAGLETYYQQELQWSGCGGDFECATMRVPSDYGDPAGGDDLAVEVVRLPASGEDRLGALVVNPGGPGASGVEYARAARAIVTADVLAAYDIVGFDPRGVGSSDPVDCLTDAELDTLLAADPTPEDAAEAEELVRLVGAVGPACQERSPDIAPWMDTRSVARDLDILRAALGEGQLDYLGKSYGTAIGTVYAEQFPANVGRFVLDGALPVDLSSEEISRGQAAGFEVALQRFVADCLTRQDCPLRAAAVADGVAEIQAFLTGLDAAPLPADGGRELNEALGVTAVLYYLYFPPNDWTLLRQGLAEGFAGDGSLLLAMLEQRLERDLAAGTYRTNSQEAFYAVSCLDRPTRSVEQIAQDADTWSAESPTFGPYLAWSDAVCAQWPIPAVAEPRPVAADGAAPILVVSTQYDPATPYEWGVRMVDTFADAALVSWNGDGHTAYFNGSPCVDDAVDAYLLAGTVPAADPRCDY